MRSHGDSLDRREARFRTLLRDGFDLPFIARFTLGKTWRRATPNQQSEFVEAFCAYVLRTYSMRFGGYAGETMTIVSERAAGDQDVVVRTRIDRPSGAPVDARWRVRTTGGRLRIIDVMVEGISMAVTQRDEFASAIQDRGLRRPDRDPARAHQQDDGGVTMNRSNLGGRAPRAFALAGAFALAVALALGAWSGQSAFAASFETGWAAYQRGDFASALDEWRRLAEAGDARAQFNLGVMYDDGRGVDQDSATAIRYWRRAAELGIRAGPTQPRQQLCRRGGCRRRP